MNTVQGNAVMEEAQTEASPAPRRKYRRRALDLPEGMTPEILGWACDVGPSGLYRWKTGTAMTDLARLAVALWQHLGREKFIETMKTIRESDPPEESSPRNRLNLEDSRRETNIPDLIVEILENAEEPVTRDFIQEILMIEFGKHTTKHSLYTMLGKMKSQGRIFSPERGLWTLRGSAEKDTPSGPDTAHVKNETHSGP
jgi:hypothetical protein